MMGSRTPGHSLGHIESFTIDWETGRVEILARNGQRLDATIERQAATDSVVKSVFRVQDSIAELHLADGLVLETEIGDDRTVVDRPVVYLDQLHWVTLAQILSKSDRLNKDELPAGERIIELARSGQLILPISGAHLVETGRTGGDRRVNLARCQTELSRGWQMRSPLHVRKLELIQVFSGVPEMPAEAKSWVFSLEPRSLWSDRKSEGRNDRDDLPSDVRDLVDRLSGTLALYQVLLEREPESSAEGVEISTRWAKSLHELALHMRTNPAARKHRRKLTGARFLVDIQQDLAEVALNAGLTPEEFAAWFAGQAEADIATTPHLSRMREIFHLRLINSDDAWEANDLNDLLYLSTAAGYSDVLVGESKFSNYLNRVAPEVPAGAKVFRRLRDSLPEIELLVAQN